MYSEKKLPFTPGIIPKEKGRIAASIGEAISQNLMNEEILRNTLLSEEMLGKVGAAFDDGIYQLRDEQKSLKEFLSDIVGKEDFENAESQIKREITQTVSETLVTADLGQKIAHLAVDHAIKKMQSGLMGLFHIEKLLDNLRTSAEDLLTKNIEEMLASNAPALVSDMVDKGLDTFSQKTIASLLEGREEQIGSVRNSVLKIYRQTVEHRLPAILATLNIKQIIENRINGMDVVEVERLIFEVMDKELTAIIRLGILLGFIMGCLNCLFL